MTSSDFARLMEQVRALTPQEKVALCDALGTPVTQLMAEKKREHAEEYIGKMNAIVGEDVRSHGRKSALVNARAILAYTLRKEGYTYQDIGGYLGGRNHATVINICGLMQDALTLPRQYADIMHLYNKFNQAINDGQGFGSREEGEAGT